MAENDKHGYFEAILQRVSVDVVVLICTMICTEARMYMVGALLL